MAARHYTNTNISETSSPRRKVRDNFLESDNKINTEAASWYINSSLFATSAQFSQHTSLWPQCTHLLPSPRKKKNPLHFDHIYDPLATYWSVSFSLRLASPQMRTADADARDHCYHQETWLCSSADRLRSQISFSKYGRLCPNYL